MPRTQFLNPCLNKQFSKFWSTFLDLSKHLKKKNSWWFGLLIFICLKNSKINIAILTLAPEIYLTLITQTLQHFFKNSSRSHQKECLEFHLSFYKLITYLFSHLNHSRTQQILSCHFKVSTGHITKAVCEGSNLGRQSGRSCQCKLTGRACFNTFLSKRESYS